MPCCRSSRLRALVLAGFLVLGTGAAARADTEADKAAIMHRLQAWAAAFNARDAAGVCDVFAPDLISTVPDAADAGHDAVCARLTHLLARTDASFRYTPAIQEIIVSGDLAAVRLIWTLTTRHDDKVEMSREAGLDLFRRQPDGRWSIIRFLAFILPSR